MRLFTNNAESTLAAPVSSVALSIQVATGEGARFPSPTGAEFFNLTICKVTGGVENTIEIVKVTARSSDIMTIERAQEGTTAQTYTTGDRVSVRFTAAPANEFAEHVVDNANPHATTAVQVGAEPTITGGTTAQYWRGDKTWRDFFTDVRAATLTGLSTATNAVVTAADTVLVAIGLLQKQITDLTTTVSGKIDSTYLDTDVTLAANSDTKIATQKAVKAYADGLIAANDAMVFKGVIDCSANPNYPAGNRGDTYRVSVAGKIGGASGPNVEAGDILLCLTDGTASGNQATVGASWSIIQVNIDGAVTLTGTQTLTNKTIALGSNTVSGTTAQFNTALTDGDFATLAGTETLTNKTLTTPVIASISNSGTVTLPSGTRTLVARDTTDTLTNKTLTSPALTTPVITGGREVRVAIGASNFDLATANLFTRTVSGTTTFTVSNTPATGTVASFILDLTNGGSATVNWFSGVKWAGGVAPTLTAAGRDVLGFFTHDGGTTWTGLVLGLDVK